MKKQTRFIAQQAAMLDRSAARIFTLTRLTVNIALLLSLGLLVSAPLFSDRIAVRLLADGLFHAAFRIAAVGTATGFAADIVMRHREK